MAIVAAAANEITASPLWTQDAIARIGLCEVTHQAVKACSITNACKRQVVERVYQHQQRGHSIMAVHSELTMLRLDAGCQEAQRGRRRQEDRLRPSHV
jgi:hypothetical protein